VSSPVAGIIFLLGFAVSQAFRDAFFGSVFQSVSFFLVILLGFGPSTLCFAGAALRASGGIRPLLSRPSHLAALNAATAFGWIAYFFALKHLEPAVVNTLHTGVGPLTVLAIAGLGTTNSTGTRIGALEGACYVGIALSLIALVAVSLSGRSGLQGADLTTSLLALASVLIGGALIAIGHMIARHFNDLGASSSAVMGLRFLLTLPAAAAAEIGLGDPALRPPMSAIGYLLIAAFGLVAVPSFMLQLGIARASPLAVNVIRALGPVFVFAVQQLDGRLRFSGATLACVLAFCFCAVAGSVLRAVSEVRRPDAPR
jgi:drug/metabolite transporter (DMT)-like permease